MGSGVMGTGYSYDGLGRLTRIDSEIDVSDREYTYRTSGTATTGQVTKLNYPNLLGGNTTTYTYDKQNQLTREDNQAAGKTWVWTYDDAGNILSRKEYAYTTGTLGTVLDTVNYTYGNSNWGDLLTAYDGQAITHDGIGNPLPEEHQQFDAVSPSLNEKCC